jgi:hypothetical protein
LASAVDVTVAEKGASLQSEEVGIGRRDFAGAGGEHSEITDQPQPPRTAGSPDSERNGVGTMPEEF